MENIEQHNSSGYVMKGFWEYFGPDGNLYRTEFTADEVKRMVRALFQNTDRRAGVLSRIR